MPSFHAASIIASWGGRNIPRNRGRRIFPSPRITPLTVRTRWIDSAGTCLLPSMASIWFVPLITAWFGNQLPAMPLLTRTLTKNPVQAESASATVRAEKRIRYQPCGSGTKIVDRDLNQYDCENYQQAPSVLISTTNKRAFRVLDEENPVSCVRRAASSVRPPTRAAEVVHTLKPLPVFWSDIGQSRPIHTFHMHRCLLT